MGGQETKPSEVVSVKEAVHKLQLHLLEGIKDDNKLFAAGSLMARPDYEDIVSERSILKLCGYPLCSNLLPSEQPKKGRYRIALKEHKVYDLQETSMYCSAGCLINSRVFAGSLQEKRCSVLNVAKINDIMRLFEKTSLGSDEGRDDNDGGDLGLSKLMIQEKMDVKGGEVTFEEWVGPPNAIEGYVPERDPNYRLLRPEEKGSQPGNQTDIQSKPLHVKQSGTSYNQMGISGTILSPVKLKGSNEDHVPLRSKSNIRGTKSKTSEPNEGKDATFRDADFMSVIIAQDEYSISKEHVAPPQTVSNQKAKGSKGKLDQEYGANHSTLPSDSNNTQITDIKSGKAVLSSKTTAKSARKSSGSKTHLVTWADEKNGGNLCEVRELGNTGGGSQISNVAEVGDDADLHRLASAKACAIALSQAAEAVASGMSNVSDAVSEAGIVFLPQQQATDGEECLDDDSKSGFGSAAVKSPDKPRTPDMAYCEDSWFDPPPEGFSLILSPFGTIWNALFNWITSSSLAYIYGRDESSHLEYLCVNGTEYPQKIILADGRSSEIKQALSGCLARALPDVVMDLKVRTPTPTLGHGLGLLLDTMSFVDALPPFRMKQWQVVVLLFIDALSVCRIPALMPHWTSSRTLIPKVLKGSKITLEEYNLLTDLMLPLGREPQRP